MELKGVNIGFCLTGSFCTFSEVFPVVEELVNLGANVTPIISNAVATTDTRFIKAEETRKVLKEITGNEVLSTIDEVEPIGPKKLLDLLIIAPCTGNTIGKLASGIADTSVTLATKAHLRNKRPVLIAVSSNDALSTNAQNIGLLLNRKNLFFVPMGQDNFVKKECSVVADMKKIVESSKLALDSVQNQPILISPR